MARSFLEDERLLTAGATPAVESWGERSDMARWVVQHITLTLVAVSVSPPDSDLSLARTRGLVDLSRIRSGAFREFGP